MALAFLAFLSGGMLATLAGCKLEQVAWKFVRLVGIVAFLLAGGVAMWSLRSPEGAAADLARWAGVTTWAGAGMAFLVMVIAPLIERHATLARVLCGIGGAAGMIAGCMWSMGGEGAPTGGWTARGAAVLGGQLCGALVLGSVTVAWMLGHAYLTATRMTIAPLRSLSRLLFATVAVRVIYVTACLVGLWLAGDLGGGLSGLWAVSWPTLSLRVGAGLVLLAVFAFMVLDCVRLRSTQSATGILYFASLLAYVGELSSQHLVKTWGWPL